MSATINLYEGMDFSVMPTNEKLEQTTERSSPVLANLFHPALRSVDVWNEPLLAYEVDLKTPHDGPIPRRFDTTLLSCSLAHALRGAKLW